MTRTVTLGRYDFEKGVLVKVDQLRPEYMQGTMLLLELRKAAARILELDAQLKEVKKQLKAEKVAAACETRMVTYKFSTTDDRQLVQGIVEGNGWDTHNDFTTGRNLAVIVHNDDEDNALQSIIKLHDEELRLLQWDRV